MGGRITLVVKYESLELEHCKTFLGEGLFSTFNGSNPLSEFTVRTLDQFGEEDEVIIFYDCFITKYVFPTFNAEVFNVPLRETVIIKPNLREGF